MTTSIGTNKIQHGLVVGSFLLPSFLGFSIFVLVPTVATVGLSFTNYNGGLTAQFVGIRHYLTALGDPRFLRTLLITVRFVVGTVVLQLGIGFLLALMLNEPRPGKTFFRGLFFMPSILSTIAVAMSFMLLFNARRGPINQFLVAAGLAPFPFLTSPDTALGTIIFVSVWQQFGYFMVIFLAGLQTISPSLYENANLDGATFFQKTTRITIPMLTPTIFFSVVIAVIRGFQVFDQIFIMTGGQDGGGPAGSTSVLVFAIYQNAFSHFRMGYAAAQSTILLAIVLAITLLQYLKQKDWVNYDLA